MGSETRENAFEQISKKGLETKLTEANEKNLKLEEKIRSLERTCDVLRAQLAVKNDTIEQMRCSVSQIRLILRDFGETLFNSGAIGATFRQLPTQKVLAINQDSE